MWIRSGEALSVPIYSTQDVTKSLRQFMDQFDRGFISVSECAFKMVAQAGHLKPEEVEGVHGWLPPETLDRLKESLERFPITDGGWRLASFVGGHSGYEVAARTRQEYERLLKECVEKAKARLRHGVELLRAFFRNRAASNEAS